MTFLPGLIFTAALMLCSCNNSRVSVDIPFLLYSAGNVAEIPVNNDYQGNGKTYSLILTGDTMLSRNVERRSLKDNSFDSPFSRVSGLLRGSDIAFTNLESPLTYGENLKEGLVFRADPRFAAALKRAGFTIVSLANNHILDRGVPGLDQTVSCLENAGVLCTGADRKTLSDSGVIITLDKVKIGFLAFTDCLNSLRNDKYARDRIIDYNDPSRILAAVKRLKAEADIVVVSLHWGFEMYTEPSKQQTVLADRIIESGADIIAGHHPHVIQHYRRTGNGHVFFSLGNFVFDQMSDRKTRNSVLVRITFMGKKIEKVEAYPLMIDRNYRPVPCSGDDAMEVYRSLVR